MHDQQGGDDNDAKPIYGMCENSVSVHETRFGTAGVITKRQEQAQARENQTVEKDKTLLTNFSKQKVSVKPATLPRAQTAWEKAAGLVQMACKLQSQGK